MNFISDTTGYAGIPLVDHTISDVAAVLLEATDYLDDGWTIIGGDAPATYSGGPLYRTNSFTTIREREDGRFWPFFEDEMDLKRIRAACRRLAAFSAITVGLKQALGVYVMGGQWTHKAEARQGVDAPEKLIEEVQRVIDGNLERNEFVADLDTEIHNHVGEDGDSLIAIYPVAGGSGLSDWRRLDSEHLTEPLNQSTLNGWLDLQPREASWTFGVLTVRDDRQKRIDHTRHAGYHVVFDDAGRDWDYLPSWPQPALPDTEGKCAVLLKRNVPREAKRGISDYLPVQTDLERESKLTENLSVGAAILAAIPWIEQYGKGVGREQAQTEIGNALDSFSRAVARNRGSNDRSVQRYRPGTIPKIDADKQYIAGPLGAVRQPIYIEVAQHLLRRIGIRFQMPEYMISGDASNSNYASTLVAEAPFVKAREADQRFMIRGFKAIHWRSLKVAFDAGRFDRWVRDWSMFCQLIEIVITPPEVASRDKVAQVNELNGLYDRGLIDGNEYRSDLGRDEKPELEGKTGSMPAENPIVGMLRGTQQTPPNSNYDTRRAALEHALTKVRKKSEARELLESVQLEHGTHDQKTHGNRGGAGTARHGVKETSTVATAIDKFRNDPSKVSLVDAEDLTFTEQGQQEDRLQFVRDTWEDTSDMPPVVAVADFDEASIIDGHHRATVARERETPIKAVFVSRQEFDSMKEAGFDEMEIAYAALERSGDYEAAAGLNAQFFGAGVDSRGTRAGALLGESIAQRKTKARFKKAAEFLKRLEHDSGK